MKTKARLIHGDCLEKMKLIPDGSIDMILCDPPYGTTACKWDSVIPFEPMWDELKRVIKPNGAICLFGMEPFSSALRMSNIKQFKYDWVWLKDKPAGFLNANRRPMSCHEIVSIFYSTLPLYAPQKWKSKPMNTIYKGGGQKGNDVYGRRKIVDKKEQNSEERFPLSYLKMDVVNGQSKEKVDHPTQKPVLLLEYLIKTYSLKGETVLDFTMGSGSTGVACRNLKRNFIGIEKDRTYFKISVDRIRGVK